jgi:uncharacterized protein YbcI
MATEETKTERGLSREISREMVALIKRYVGRGPTYARAYIHDDLVVIAFHDTMTKAEETLMEENQEDKVRELRHLFQGAFRSEAIALVERAVGKRVLAFLSDHAVDPDWAVEVFVLDAGQE